jgi:hypothetical protein
VTAETCYDCGADFAHCECEGGPVVCECQNITGRWDDEELFDSSQCRAHGPHSTSAKEAREREAAEEVAWWQSMGEF